MCLCPKILRVPGLMIYIVVALYARLSINSGASTLGRRCFIVIASLFVKFGTYHLYPDRTNTTIRLQVACQIKLHSMITGGAATTIQMRRYTRKD